MWTYLNEDGAADPSVARYRVCVRVDTRGRRAVLYQVRRCELWVNATGIDARWALEAYVLHVDDVG